MKIRKKFFAITLLVSVLISSVVPVNAAAATVTLPSFDVTLNGVKIENEHRKYPFIVYKGITYFPMTYHDSRFLRLETIWNKETGLGVNNIEGQGSYAYNKPELLNKKNASKYSVNIVTFKIRVNGKTIDNSKEEYPLLLFRDITYFPMTWHFGVDEFGWEYNFTMETGLTIHSVIPPEKPVFPIINELIFEYENLEARVQLEYDRCLVPGNLYIIFEGKERKEIGNADYAYGYKSEVGGHIWSDDYMEFKDGWIYINAYNHKEGGISSVYKVNIKTGETLKAE